MDHLDYIRIRGLEDGELECFQGIGASSSSSSGGSSGGTSGSPSAFEWGEIPEEAITLLGGYTDELISWLSKANAYDSESGSRGLPALLEDIPVVPAIIGASALATGGLTLPAVATVMGVQAITNFTAASLQQFAADMDENSPKNKLIELVEILKAGLTYGDDNQGVLQKALLLTEAGDQVSVLDRGLNYDIEVDGEKIHHSVLKDKLEDLKYNDEVIDFGATRLHLKSKIIEY